LEAEIQATCRDLSIPLPIPVSVLLGSLGHLPSTAAEATAAAAAAAAAGGVVPAAPAPLRGAAAEASCNVFVQVMLAAIHPDGHVPDTPERKVSRGREGNSPAADTVLGQAIRAPLHRSCACE